MATPSRPSPVRPAIPADLLSQPFEEPCKVVIDLSIAFKDQEDDDGVHVPSMLERLMDAGLGRTFLNEKSTDVRRSDGFEIFGEEGMENVSFARVVSDLEARGLVLIYAGLTQRSLDGEFVAGILRMVFKPANNSKAFKIPAAARPLVEECLARSYNWVHAFRNPDGSEAVIGLGLGGHHPVCELRFGTDGEIKTEVLPPRPPKKKKPRKPRAP